MTGISITVELNDLGARQALRDLLARMDNPLGFYKNVGDRLMFSLSTRFETQTDLSGAPWAPLAPRTIKQRQARGQLPLTILRSNSKGARVKNGSSLAGSINAYPSADGVSIGSPVPYAAIHQLGGTIQKPESTRYMVGRRFAKRDQDGGKDVKIKAHTITIPARPYIGISSADEEGILEDAQDWLTR